MRTLTAAFALLLFATDCGAGRPTVQAANQEVTATASGLNVRHFRGYDYVFGRLTIRGTSHTLLTADLDCFSLQVGSSKSDGVYVASFIDELTGDYPARNGTVSVAVYWSMKDFKSATDKDLTNITLAINKRYQGSCFGFGPAVQHQPNG